MKISTLGFYLLHPVKALRRALYKVYEIRHKDEPWLAKRAVEYCEGILTKEVLLTSKWVDVMVEASPGGAARLHLSA